MAEERSTKQRQRSGLRSPADPRAEERAKGGPGRQQQAWPGQEREMRPRPDHGEESYRGAGRLEGRKALITGADSGIGKAVAIAFAREGADVAIAYFDEDDDARDSAAWVEKAGRKAVLLPGDLQTREHCREVVANAVRELGGLDILVNNAAYHCQTERLEDIDEGQLERTFRTNVFAMFFLTQAALAHMPAGASIINTGSVVALRGSPELIDYSATKGAVEVFTKSLARNLSSRGIRVNSVAPGPVWTPLIPATKKPENVESFGTSSEWERPAQPAELAPAFVFFASADSRYCTGETLAVTGEATTP
jgi:NAD(P)-dependent dehydrogenase (short-subunit alcohol dehydrogenase family)